MQIPRSVAYRAIRTESTENQPGIRTELEQMGDLLKTRLIHVAPWMKGRLGVALHLPKKPHRELSDFEILHPKIEYNVDNTPNLDRLPEYHHFPENKLSGAHGMIDTRHRQFNVSTEWGDMKVPSVGAAAPISLEGDQTIGFMLTQVGLGVDQQVVAQENGLVIAATPEQDDVNGSKSSTKIERDTFQQDDALKSVTP